MKNIKDLVPKPSDAVKAMIDGLEKFGNPETTKGKFKIEMGTFGFKEDGICFGCAATCAAMEITGKTYRSFIDPLNHDQRFRIEGLDEFELMIDWFRQGDLLQLEVFYHEFEFSTPMYSHKWNLRNENWKDQLPKVKEYYRWLISIGL